MLLSLILLIAALFILTLVVWNTLAWPRVEAAGRAAPQMISVLIPARNEESNLAACLDEVLLQGESVREVLVYDDHSTDRTPEIAARYAMRDGRVRLIAGAELPPGWCGKNFACAQLASSAAGEWLLFLDADARLASLASARLLEEARLRNLTLLSGWPALVMAGWWEKTLMPMLNFVVFTLFPAPLSLIRQDPSLGLAHGACLLVHRATYLRVGGHAAVRNEIQDDGRMARLWRARGERGLCLDGRQVVSVRMYRSFAEIWAGFQKNFFPIFHHEHSFWAFIALHAALFLAPFIITFWLAMDWAAEWPLLMAAASVLLMRVALALRFKHPLWSVLLHPLAEVVLIALGLSSWWKCKSGRGVEWKGRRLLND